MIHGSTVTYNVHCARYLPPRVLAAAVMACISAWAVTSVRVSVRLCARAMILSLHTTTAPTGTSPRSKAFSASSNASEAVSAWLLDLSVVEGLLSGYFTTVTEYVVELLANIYPNSEDTLLQDEINRMYK